MVELSEQEVAAIVAMQRGLPLTSHPFQAVGETCGLTEEAVVACVRRLVASGDVRRLGGVFDARRIGFCSALCAMDIPDGALENFAKRVTASPEVTHAYERGWPAELPSDLPGGPTERRAPNFWFTLATPSERFSAELDSLRVRCAPYPVWVFPATRRFKIDVVFDPRTRDRDERVEPRPGALLSPHDQEVPSRLSPEEQKIVRVFQGSLTIMPDLFAAPARQLGLAENALLERLRDWQERGIMRRVGLLLRHRKFGFTANGMCCWDAPDSELQAKGRCLAAFPEVTHCYERPACPAFPFRLYAMIHTGSCRETHARFLRISQATGLVGGRLLFSLREFKKTSMTFF